jgi:hypothetical protein
LIQYAGPKGRGFKSHSRQYPFARQVYTAAQHKRWWNGSKIGFLEFWTWDLWMTFFVREAWLERKALADFVRV